jgi:16S rRNA (adenine1518-N6/adenine1519-N6)-dimethyltransferase
LKPKTWGRALEADFETLGKAAFSYRRKTLQNSLSRHPDLGTLAPLLLERAGVDGSRRAEELSVEEYEHLAQTYSKLRLAHDQ